MTPATYRHELETSILSCALMMQSVYVGADILKANNFSNKIYSTIWNGIIQLHNRQEAINYLTLYNELKTDDEAKLALYQISTAPFYGVYVGHEAYILLEIDIRDKFLKSLSDIVGNKNKYELDEARTALLKDWIFELQTDEKLDIFDSIALIISLFHKYDFNTTCTHIVEEFEENINTKAKSLRKHNQYHAICTNINASGIDENTKQEIIQFIKSKI